MDRGRLKNRTEQYQQGCPGRCALRLAITSWLNFPEIFGQVRAFRQFNVSCLVSLTLRYYSETWTSGLINVIRSASNWHHAHYVVNNQRANLYFVYSLHHVSVFLRLIFSCVCLIYIYNFISPSKTVARKETKKKRKNIYNTVRISQHLADIRRHR